MDRVLKEAMPPLAATVVVPLRVPPPALRSEERRVGEEWLVSRLLNWYSTRTVTTGLMATPADALVGCCKKGRWFAAPGVMLKSPEVAASRLASAAVSV